MTLRSKSRYSKSRRFFTTLFFVLIIGLGAGGFILFFEGEQPVVNLDQTKSFIGKNGEILYTVSDGGNGLRSIKVLGIQGPLKKELFSTSFSRASYTGQAGPPADSRKITFDVLKDGFKDGSMSIQIQATDFSMQNWFKGNTTTLEKSVTVDTVPPRIQILHSEKYISPGGTGIAIYRLSDKDSIHGVNVNGVFNPGFLVGDGRDDTYISYFALPYYADTIESLNVSAVDKAGNNALVTFTTIYKKSHFKKDTINVSDGFLNSKIPEFQQYYPEMKGEFLDKYLYANNTIRKENNTKISDLCRNPSPERLWSGKFNRMSGSSRAGFADHRTYYFNKKAIDKQVHLGMDIASTRRADVRAANSGIVIYAEYLGIYGNMVMLDHGQGVFSLYSHLSQINVKPGDNVNKKSVLGLTGTTGMAGGDHLHFSMLINGIFVTPKEWWDQHWIEVTIDEPLIDSKF